MSQDCGLRLECFIYRRITAPYALRCSSGSCKTAAIRPARRGEKHRNAGSKWDDDRVGKIKIFMPVQQWEDGCEPLFVCPDQRFFLLWHQ